jgi:hypothetical protein
MTKVSKKHLTPADAKPVVSAGRVKNFKVGTIVRCTTNAVLVTGKGNTKETGYPCFAGVVVMAIFNGEDDVWPVGMFSDTWTLDAFKKTDIDISSMIAGWLSVG